MLAKFRKLLFQIATGVIGIWLANELIQNVSFDFSNLQILLLAGTVLGFINFFIRPVLNLVTLPLRILTFGLFSLLINIGIIWVMDILFIEFVIEGLVPLFWTTIIIWVLSLIASKL